MSPLSVGTSCLAVATACWVLVPACRAASPGPAPPAPSPTSTSRSQPPPATTSTASATAAAVGQAVVEDTVPAGHFACLSQTNQLRACRAGVETCCEAGGCVPRGSEPQSCIKRSECDISADCPEGQTCCQNSYALELPYYAHRCQPEPCREAESCRQGSCPTGQRCYPVFLPGEIGVGRCVSTHGEVTCGAHVCRGETPHCEWNPESRTGQCVAPDGGTSPWPYTCDDDADCFAGERCWLGIAGGSYCCRGESCFDHAASTKYTPCKTAKDCPVLEGMRFSCRADPELPPSIARWCYPIYLDDGG